MTDEVTRFWAGTPRLMYAAKTEPEMVENPDDLNELHTPGSQGQHIGVPEVIVR